MTDNEKTSAEYLTIPEIVTISDVSRPTAYAWVKNGWLKTYKIGGQVRVTPEAWHEFLNREN